MLPPGPSTTQWAWRGCRCPVPPATAPACHACSGCCCIGGPPSPSGGPGLDPAGHVYGYVEAFTGCRAASARTPGRPRTGPATGSAASASSARARVFPPLHRRGSRPGRDAAGRAVYDRGDGYAGPGRAACPAPASPPASQGCRSRPGPAEAAVASQTCRSVWTIISDFCARTRPSGSRPRSFSALWEGQFARSCKYAGRAGIAQFDISDSTPKGTCAWHSTGGKEKDLRSWNGHPVQDGSLGRGCSAYHAHQRRGAGSLCSSTGKHAERGYPDG
jgi:hypothetical protein